MANGHEDGRPADSRSRRVAVDVGIAALVLVPFSLMVALGFRALDGDHAPPGTSAAPAPGAQRAFAPARSSPPPVVTPSLGLAPPGSAAPPGPGRPPPKVVADAGPPPEPAFPAPVAVALRAVAPEVRRCVQDMRHPADRVDITVTFCPTPDGGFTGVTVATSFPDPFLAACVEDVFAEVHFAPSGAEDFAPATHTFSVQGDRPAR